MKRPFAALIAVVAVVGLAQTALSLSGNTDKELKPAFSDVGFQPVEWTDLTPPLTPEAKRAAAELNLRIDQMTDEEISRAMEVIEREGSVLVPELDDTDISIEGFLVPLDFDAKTVKDFVLVPYFGACIHVPPPPPNQIVYVQFKKGLPMEELETSFYTPFRVQGRIKAAFATTDIADVGYQMITTDIEKGEEL